MRQTGDLLFGLDIIYNVFLLLYNMLKNKNFFLPLEKIVFFLKLTENLTVIFANLKIIFT